MLHGGDAMLRLSGVTGGTVQPVGDSVGDSVGARLRYLRTSRRLTQRQLADRARLSLEAVWTIENGRKHPRRSTASLLAEALGVDTAALLRP